MKFAMALAGGLILMANGVSAYAVDAGGATARPQQNNHALRAVHKAPATAPGIVKGSDYIGKEVTNPGRESLGEIVDLAINGARSKVSYAVMASGGFFGIGREFYAVPLDAFSPAAEDDDLVLNISKARLDTQPGFDSDHWPAHANTELVEQPVPSKSISDRVAPQTPTITRGIGKGARDGRAVNGRDR